MFEGVIDAIVSIKQDFAQNYKGSAHIQEVLPASKSEKFPIDKSHLNSLHKFAKKNPIYHNSYEETVKDNPCIVYEGDINDYWLNSIKHGSSCQPFYPTWIISAYIMTSITKELGYSELVDIGSGDGRIAFCGKILGFNTHSIEIDDALVELQKRTCESTNTDFNPICKDALEFDYTDTNLAKPAFFIGGLPQMGGDILATDLVEKINSIANLKQNSWSSFCRNSF